MKTGMSPHVNAKLPNIGITIFTLMSNLAAEKGAVNLGQGFPDFDPPALLLDRVAHHLRSGHNQYAPMAGVPALLEQVAAKVGRLHGVDIDPQAEITVSAGGTESIFCAIQSVVHPGDEVVLLDPCFDCYEPAVELAGGRVVHVPLALPDFRIDFERLAAALSPRTRLVVVNTPHNPSGAVMTGNDWARLAAMMEPTGAFLLSDEVYEHLVYDDRPHVSALSVPSLRARAFVVFSFGKVFNATGWKVGYCIAPPALSAALRKVHQFVTFSVSTPVQYALADYLESSPEFLTGLPRFYQARRDRFIELLAGSRFKLAPSPGTYFQLVDYSAISRAADVEYCRELVDHHGVAAIPVSPFCEVPPDCHLLRFCFAKSDETLEAAAERLRRA
jgi:methionine aminotransferase